MSSTDQAQHLSGFAKKKALEELGFGFVPLISDDYPKGTGWSCVDDTGTVVAQARLQGEVVNLTIEKLGGL